MIDVQELSFAYPGRPPLFAGLSWRAGRGESWSVIGPSGCGKSTLLYLLAGLRRPTSGEIRIAGERLHGVRPATGLILQDFGLLPWATAGENIALGMKLRGVARSEQQAVVADWLDRLGLAHVRHHYPAEMSGGQRQRVAIARTLALQPDLLLMDEPFASLDTITREDLQNLVVRVGLANDRTTIVVTHNIDEAVFLSSNILVLSPALTETATVIVNPYAQDPGMRNTRPFLEKCREVRDAIEGQQSIPSEYTRAR